MTVMTSLAHIADAGALSTQSDAAEGAVTASGDMCRLVVIGPSSRVELAVPSHIPIAELVPTIVGHLDPVLATRGLSHGGWVLQRLGQSPLDENRSTASSGLLDGDVLYLRPRGDELSEAQYDDLVDGVQSSLRARGDEWVPARTRGAILAALAIACLAAAAVASTLGFFAPIAAFILAMVCAGSGALVGRFWDSAAGDVLLYGSVVLAAVAGATVPEALFPESGAGLLVQIMTTVAAAAVVAASGAYARGGLQPALLAVIGGAIIVVFALAVPVFLQLSPQAGAAVTMLVLIAVARAIPTLSAWIAGLEVDSVPTSPEEFQTDLDTISVAELADKATRVHAVVTAFWLTWAAIECAAICLLGISDDWASLALALTGCVATLLQSRELPATAHRAALLIAAAVPLTLIAFVHAARLSTAWQVAVIAAIVMFAAYAVVAVRLLPGRRLAPTWGRAGDVAHWLCAIAVPALVLAVTGVYSWLADLF